MAAFEPIKIKYNPVTNAPWAGTSQDNYVGAQTVAGRRGTLPTFSATNDIWVSKAGSDSNAGTQAAPLLTLGKAFSTTPSFNDTSGNAYHLTQVGTVPTVSFPDHIIPPQGNTCAGPFTLSNYLSAPAGLLTAMSSLSAFSWQGWFMVTDFGADSRLMGFTDGALTELTITTDGKVRFTVNGTNYDSAAGTVVLNTWYYIAASFSSGTTNGLNILVGRKPTNMINVMAATTTYTTGTISSFYIGRTPYAGNPFLGYMDRVFISNAAATSFPMPQPAISTTNLLAAYNFETDPLVSTGPSAGGIVPHIVIADSGTYNEGLYANLEYDIPGFVGIYSADGYAPTFEVVKGAVNGTYGAGNAARTVSGTPNYYISKAGNDATGQRGNAALPFLTIQGALNDSSRVGGDVLEIQDNGVYQENINWGAYLLGTLRAASGKTPTLKALPVTPGNEILTSRDYTTIPGSPYQITPVPTAGNFYTDLGVVFTASGMSLTKVTGTPYGGQYAESGGVYTFSSSNIGDNVTITYQISAASALANITWSFNGAITIDGLILNGQGTSQYLHKGYAGTAAIITNCTIINYSTLQSESNGFYTNCSFRNITAYTMSAGVSFTNCSVTGPGETTEVSFGASFSGAIQSTFINMAISATSNSGASIVLRNNLFQKASFSIVDTNYAANTYYKIYDCVFYNGYLRVERLGTATNSTTVFINNLLIDAWGYTYALKLNNAGGALIINAYASNICAVGAVDNFLVPIALSTNSYLYNCTSLNATGHAINAPVNAMAVQGFLDSGSAAYTTGGIVPTSSEQNALVISTAQGAENPTLECSDSGNLSTVDIFGASASKGIGWAAFIVTMPTTFNGLIIQGCDNLLTAFSGQEGGIKCEAPETLTVKFCTFSMAGPYAVQVMQSSTIDSNLFTENAGHCILTDSVDITVQNNVAWSCAGAFINNYGENMTTLHNTTFNCMYGQFDISSSFSNNSFNVYSASGKYDYSGESVQASSCIGTLDPTRTGLVDGTSTQLDPLFWDADNGDLRLQSQAWGYYYDSPASLKSTGLASDMGAFAITYGTEATTWSTLDFGAVDSVGPATGPWRNPDIIPRNEMPIHLNEDDQENGAPYAVAAAFRREYVLEWNQTSNPMPTAQTTGLLELFNCGNNEIQINFGAGSEFGDVYIPAYILLKPGFTYQDMIAYSDNTVPEPVKQIIIRLNVA